MLVYLRKKLIIKHTTSYAYILNVNISRKNLKLFLQGLYFRIEPNFLLKILLTNTLSKDRNYAIKSSGGTGPMILQQPLGAKAVR